MSVCRTGFRDLFVHLWRIALKSVTSFFLTARTIFKLFKFTKVHLETGRCILFSIGASAIVLAWPHPCCAGELDNRAPDASVVRLMATQLPKVDVSAATDNELRRDFFAGKLIIGRKAIDDSGVQSVYDLLKQQPSITVAADGRLGLIGLPGYTQILVDGAPPTSGKSPMELDVIHVERIEIVKSSLAEFGPYGTAGTINILTRKPSSKTSSQLRLTTSGGAAIQSANLGGSVNQAEAGSPLRWNAQLSAGQTKKMERGETVLSTQLSSMSPHDTTRSDANVQSNSPMISINGSLAWQMGAHNQFDLAPSLVASKIDSLSAEHYLGAVPTGSLVQYEAKTDRTLLSVSLPLKWTLKPDGSHKLTLRYSPTRYWLTDQIQREDLIFAQPNLQWLSTQRATHSVDFLKADYSRDIGEDHEFKAGASFGRNHGRVDLSSWVNDLPDLSLHDLGSNREELSRKSSFFVQDEWSLNKQFAFNVGMSGEQNQVDIHEGSYDSTSRYTLLAPSAHFDWKLEGDSKRHVRISLARTFNAPFVDQLRIRPTINPLASCPINGLCGTNKIEYADIAGNPGLRPESASGVNVTYEQHFGEESLISVDIYSRTLDDVIGTDLQLQSVPWAQVPRYVARPANLGAAWIRGLTLETHLNLREFWKDAPRLAFRSGISLARSWISALPAPDNQMADQRPWSAKLGVKYKMNGLPIEFSADTNWAPAGWIRSSIERRLYNDRRFDLDMQAAWVVSPDMRLRFSVDGLMSARPLSVEELSTTNETVTRVVMKNSYVKLGLRLELKL